MLCRKCNKAIDDNSLICPYCGSQITNEINLKHEDESIVNGVVEKEVPSDASNNVISDVDMQVHQVESIGTVSNIEATTSQNISLEPVNINTVSSDNTNNAASTEYKTEEKANVGLVILSWFIPLVGFILFFVKKKTSPKTAKVSGLCALISFLLSTFIIMFVVITAVRFTNKVIDEAKDSLNQSINETIDGVDNFIKENEDEINKVIDDTKDKLEEIDVNLSDLQDIESLDNDWKKYEVKINNKKVVLPTNYPVLSLLTGFRMKTTEEKNYLAPNYYKLVNLYDNDKYVLNVEIYNDTTEDILNVSAKITRIMQTKYQVDNGADVVYFPGNLKAGDPITHEKIIEFFGEPTNKREYNDEGYNSVEYTYNEDTTWTTTKFFKIRVLNGVIDELTLDNRR